MTSISFLLYFKIEWWCKQVILHFLLIQSFEKWNEVKCNDLWESNLLKQHHHTLYQYPSDGQRDRQHTSQGSVGLSILRRFQCETILQHVKVRFAWIAQTGRECTDEYFNSTYAIMNTVMNSVYYIIFQISLIEQNNKEEFLSFFTCTSASIVFHLIFATLSIPSLSQARLEHNY